jgi:hypothetical protein
MGDGILNRLRAGAVGLNRFAVPPSAFISSATAWALSADFSYVITTSAPARASDSAIARPNPRLAPVTSAFLPVKSICMMTSLREW